MRGGEKPASSPKCAPYERCEYYRSKRRCAPNERHANIPLCNILHQRLYLESEGVHYLELQLYLLAGPAIALEGS